ncbi:Fe-S cluster assembly ATPase SufC [Candidatus Gottesmanbacteria bacterium]|nr:Fe-S cluster assembly ATPase SufC [Candidatus Gottesmanbacteria bacterium]
MLEIKHITASFGEKKILNDVSLSVHCGELHAIMGPNGSGKSTFASVLLGHPAYTVVATKGKKASIELDGVELLKLATYDRVKKGLFLAFQSPLSIPGVSVMHLLRSAYQEIHPVAKKLEENLGNAIFSKGWSAEGVTLVQFIERVKSIAREISIDESFLKRGIHDGFSGGEKKKVEMLTALVLLPKYAIFDEIDTGLDVDALKIVAAGIERLRKQGTGVIVVTHYQRILSYVHPSHTHILVNGVFVEHGTGALSERIEKEGYAKYEKVSH